MRPTVRKDELLAKLEDNRSRHRGVFEAAVEGWYKQAQAELGAARRRILKDAPKDIHIRLEAPKDHTRDYDRAIAMVKMHQGDTMQLSEEDVAKYIQDDWRWKRMFLSNSSGYAAATVSETYGGDWGDE